MLEQAVNERAGKLALAKVDTEANPRLAAAFRIQGIPAVKAFKDGRIASEFTGAQPPAVVARFLDALLPSEADALVAAGGEEDLRRALELEPSRADAGVALARILAERGEREDALAILARVPRARSPPRGWPRGCGSRTTRSCGPRSPRSTPASSSAGSTR